MVMVIETSVIVMLIETIVIVIVIVMETMVTIKMRLRDWRAVSRLVRLRERSPCGTTGMVINQKSQCSFRISKHLNDQLGPPMSDKKFMFVTFLFIPALPPSPTINRAERRRREARHPKTVSGPDNSVWALALALAYYCKLLFSMQDNFLYVAQGVWGVKCYKKKCYRHNRPKS